jgi:cytochrome c553
MKRVLFALALSLPVSVFADGASAADPFVKGDAKAGAAKAAVCGACHGASGNGAINPIWPKLAAQSSKYVYEQLVAFKSGKRGNAVMMGQAAALSEQDMADLAAYFAAQPAVPGVASEKAVPVAQKLYRAGDATRGLPACSACHGPTGAGNPAAAYPQLAGQNAGYSASSLRAYRAGERGKEGNGQMMAAVAKHLTDAEIDALSSYISGLQ